MDTATIGTPAPGFRAPSSHGQTLDLDAFVGKLPVVLAFVSDVTGPLNEAALADLDDHLVDFGRERVQLLVVAPCTPKEVREIADERQYSLTLLADPHPPDVTGSIASAFVGSIDAESVGIVVIDRDGKVVDRGNESPVGDVAQRVLRRLDRLAGDAPRS